MTSAFSPVTPPTSSSPTSGPERAAPRGGTRGRRSQTALLTVAAALRQVLPDAAVVGIACRRSPLRGHPLLDKVATSPGEVPALVDAALVSGRPVLVLIDDADGLADDGRLLQLFAGARPDLHVVAAGRADVLRTSYGHWTQNVRRSKSGILWA
jgi:S-DNA-T family DNA segregation ATPase FtsK/SpoIIIE